MVKAADPYRSATKPQTIFSPPRFKRPSNVHGLSSFYLATRFIRTSGEIRLANYAAQVADLTKSCRVASIETRRRINSLTNQEKTVILAQVGNKRGDI